MVEFGMGLVGRVFLVGRPHPWILNSQGRCYDLDFSQAAQISSGNNNPTDAGVHGQIRHETTMLGQFIAPVYGTKFAEELLTIADGISRRWFNKGKIIGSAKPECMHAQDHFGQVGSFNFRQGETVSLEVVFFAEQAYTDAWPDTSAAPGPLIAAGS